MTETEYYDYEDSDQVGLFQEQDLRILKGVISDLKLATDFATHVGSDVFFGNAKIVGKVICDYVKTYKALPTERVLLDKYKKKADIIEQIKNFYSSISDVEWIASEFHYDLEKVKQKFTETKITSLTDHLKNNDLSRSVQELEKTLKEIKDVNLLKKNAYTQKSLDDYLSFFHEDYVNKLKNPEHNKGILTGYSYLDYICNGLRPAELLIIAGETGSGKSVLLNNLALNMWMQQNTIITDPSQYTPGCNVLYFSLEMPFSAMYRRTLCALADIPIYGLRDARLTKSEVESLNLASKFIKNFSKTAKFEIVDIARGVTINEIEERFLEARERFDPKLKTVVAIDYLGLMDDDERGDDDWLKLGKIAGKVHEFSRMYEVPTITGVQMNTMNKSKKEASTEEKIGTHRIGRSRLILHHANIGIMLENRDNEDMRDDAVAHIIKNRDGERGKFFMRKKFAHAKLFDIPWTPPSYEDNFGLLSGFEDEDISEQVKKLLGI